MTLATGAGLSHYEILSPLGAGAGAELGPYEILSPLGAGRMGLKPENLFVITAPSTSQPKQRAAHRRGHRPIAFDRLPENLVEFVEVREVVV